MSMTSSSFRDPFSTFEQVKVDKNSTADDASPRAQVMQIPRVIFTILDIKWPHFTGNCPL